MNTEQTPAPENRYAEICRRVVDAAKLHREQWEAWFQDIGEKHCCPRHPSQPVDVDKDRSLAESARLKSNVIIHNACPICSRTRFETSENEWLIAAGVPQNLLHCRFDNWKPRTPEDEDTLAVCRKWASAPTGALLLFGSDYGTGKTHLAIAMIRAVHRGRFLAHYQFLSKLRDTYRNSHAEDIISACIEAPFLVLDDMGTTCGGNDEQSALHRLLDERYAHARPFVLTSNANEPAELDELLGGRMLDRLIGYAYSIRTLKGESWRSQPPN